MPKKSKSQWDFGELFAEEELRKVYTVGELTTGIRKSLEEQFGRVFVSGEVTNLRIQSSGHIYFALKDADAQISCVLFRGESVSDRNLIDEGQKMIVQGDLTVYEARGQYQMIVRSVELVGVGVLQQAFERLKKKLQAEGLFETDRKRDLPEYVQRIGLVTSPTGAAIRDVHHVIERRFAGLEIIFIPCRVQGEEAAGEIARAIGQLNDWSESAEHKLDLILITRGGGSIEDLWAFNEEIVARGIFESQVPVVSAVGHEIDFTISDFVADVRAATPSAAAELITEGMHRSRQVVEQSGLRLSRLARQQLANLQYGLEQTSQRLARSHPRRQIEMGLQKLDDLAEDLKRQVRVSFNQRVLEFQSLAQRLRLLHPEKVIEKKQEELDQLKTALEKGVRRSFQKEQERLDSLNARLRLLSPENVLSRGYSITTDAKTGKVIQSPNQVSKGQRLRTRLKDGDVDSVVEK